jgi:phenylalanine-4-hydroxylase
MELNEITSQLPPHLMQFVVDQPYHQYTPIDQAVWRYVMRKNYAHLTKVAHESYVDGLNKAGIEIEKIPTMYGMNRILKKIGWAAVAVDGFIPPGAFMEFTAFKVLVIAADIRTLDHIEYTPAPDIIHESAGHAPIIAHPDFADYLVKIGKVGAKAFSSKKDYELYEAIRHLSIIKEDPYTDPKEIEEGEKLIGDISSNMGKPSEMALLRNLHWWTVEYGLIGSVDNYRIYGAGLLSSIGESESCLRLEVKKLPYTIDAAYCNYDITRPQPQLFVTPDFHHLTVVLNELTKDMAFMKGGAEGLEKAIESESTATAQFCSGLQVSGTFTNCLKDKDNHLIYFKTSGPSALAYKDKELKGHSKEAHPNGFSSPVGKIKGINVSPENLNVQYLSELGIEVGKNMQLEMETGIIITGIVKSFYKEEGKILLMEIEDCEVNFQGKMLHKKYQGNYWFALGEKISSVFSGPADIEAFQPIVNVPREKTHKINYDARTLKLHKLYGLVRDIRKTGCDDYLLPKIASVVQRHFPEDWLLNMEVFELLETKFPNKKMADRIKAYLDDLKLRRPELDKLIEDGFKLIYQTK